MSAEHSHAPVELVDPHPTTGRRLVTLDQWHARPESLKANCAFLLKAPDGNGNEENWRVVDTITPLEDGSGLYSMLLTGSDKVKNFTGDLKVYIAHDDYYILANHLGLTGTL